MTKGTTDFAHFAFLAWCKIGDSAGFPGLPPRRPVRRPAEPAAIKPVRTDRPRLHRQAPVRPVGAQRRALIRQVQAVGIHRAFCSCWAVRLPCAECDALLLQANAARVTLGVGPRPEFT